MSRKKKIEPGCENCEYYEEEPMSETVGWCCRFPKKEQVGVGYRCGEYKKKYELLNH